MTLKFHRNRSTMRTESSLMTLLLGLACAFSSSAVSLVPYNLYTLILGFILPIYAWRGPQAQQETGQNTGLVPSGTTAETTLPLAPSPSHWEDHSSLDPGSPPPPPCTPCQLSDIKEGGRESLHPPDCSHSFPRNVEEP